MSSLQPEDLVALHEWMLTEGLPSSAFSCFKDVFKTNAATQHAFNRSLSSCKRIHQLVSPAKVLHDYLGYYAQEPCTDVQRKAVSHAATFITRKELDLTTKEAIYNVFLAYPSLYDTHISYCLFLFDASRTIRHYGLRGTKEAYQQVIKLCTWALEKLAPRLNKDIVECANTALFEARTELDFAENQGFFARLFRRIQRCWAYGWTGFFKPRPPVYVAPLKSNKSIKRATQLTKSIPVNGEVRKELSVLFAELKNNLSQPALKSRLQHSHK